ncbi:MAG: hypothetical protein SFY81_10265 [Verrucomicrobiota bacterium]|nr:hypothetical protein [Verrucomicrobiota bacterium]
MEAQLAISPAPVESSAAPTLSSSVPWHCWTVVLGALCIPIGALWDISWHSTIGRDSFWTPAHIMIHLGGVLPGFTAGWLAIRSSFFNKEVAAVRLLGFRAPMGAWVIIWGACAMLLSAPFDDWWHNAYGLDVEILSPPHTVLALGMYAVAVGSLLLVLAEKNRNPEAAPVLRRLFLFNGGILLAMSTIIFIEKSYPQQQHSALFYKISCAAYPLYLVTVARASGHRWGATWVSLIYMAIVLAMIWLLPLFKAQPLLAPIYNPVDRMVPPEFPLLLVFPALGIDLILQWRKSKSGFLQETVTAFLIAAVYLLIFFLVQWNFSRFMLGPGADNWFFAGGGRNWPYWIKMGDWRREFWGIEKDPVTTSALMIALTLAFLKSRVALAAGNWMLRVQR